MKLLRFDPFCWPTSSNLMFTTRPLPNPIRTKCMLIKLFQLNKIHWVFVVISWQVGTVSNQANVSHAKLSSNHNWEVTIGPLLYWRYNRCIIERWLLFTFYFSLIEGNQHTFVWLPFSFSRQAMDGSWATSSLNDPFFLPIQPAWLPCDHASMA